ncbi:MAG: hypothetical protein LBQ90_12935 [Synergistaceae bacterium]|nr:hypothetical protein [Synergistaceae bacterium]
MKSKVSKIALAVLLVLAAYSAVLASDSAMELHKHHGGEGHHREPGYEGVHGCPIGRGFQNYDQNNYGQDGNIWCDGSNHRLSPHHGGNTVNAALPSDSSFVGGFCLAADVANAGDVLNVDYKDVAAHDKVWLKSKDDGNYYPIDRASGETSIQVKDGDWADLNPAAGGVEADVLFSKNDPDRTADRGDGDSSGGGGCDTGNLGMSGILGLVAPVVAKIRRKQGR